MVVASELQSPIIRKLSNFDECECVRTNDFQIWQGHVPMGTIITNYKPFLFSKI